jgi:dihydrofolate synthase/folylpolyglutamate synthase
MSKYITNYEEAVELIYRIPRFNENHSLDNIKNFLARMGQPDRQMKIVHIAGTNGKGSTSAYLAGLLQCAGLKVGLFTSPHLVDVRERFQINGKMISKELFTEAVQYVLELTDMAKETEESYAPCYFDMMFFVGMYAFAKEQVDILILETGLGGRLDATNAVSNKILTLITHIGLDHTEYLGDTLAAISMEKAGIMYPGVPCVVASHNDEVVPVFLQRAEELGCDCRILGKADYACQGVCEKFVAFSYFSSYYGTVPVKLNTTALYQAENVCLALAGVEALMEQGIVFKKDLSAERLLKALWETGWAGRMEEVQTGVFLDGAHNTDGIEAFLNSVKADKCEGKRIMIFSAVSDKDYPRMLKNILKSNLFSEMVLTQIAGERGVLAEKLYEEALRQAEYFNVTDRCVQDAQIQCAYVSDIEDAVSLAFTKRKHLDYIYIVGSLYLVGQVKQLLNNHSEFSVERKESRYDSV